MLTKLRYALFGVLSALAGMAVGHLVAAVTRPESSPVLAVGETVIDHTPTPVKNWAIAHFGTHDKTILVGSVLIGVLLLAGVAGVLAHRAFRYGAALLVVLVGVALYAALSRPVVHPVDALPGLVTAIVGRGDAVVAGPPRPAPRQRRGSDELRRPAAAVPSCSAWVASPSSRRPAGTPVA